MKGGGERGRVSAFFFIFFNFYLYKERLVAELVEVPAAHYADFIAVKHIQSRLGSAFGFATELVDRLAVRCAEQRARAL